MTALIYIVVISLTLSFIGMGAVGVDQWRLSKRREKKAVVPKTNYPEHGVCQCGDALCYHGLNGCGVQNCACKRYIPSDIAPEKLEALQDASVNLLMLETAEAKKKPVEYVSSGEIIARQDHRRRGRMSGDFY